MIEQNFQWQCKICGNFSTDTEEKFRTWEEHLDHHKITQERYDQFIKEYLGGLTKMKVKLLSWSNNIELAIITFINQTWGATTTLDGYREQEIAMMVEMALNGETLPTVLEAIKFTFQIEGISRACSHQLVRTRIGSGFSQKGMCDVYYGDIDYVIPATIEAVGKTKEYLELMEKCSAFYRELFEAGVPFQDARFVIPQAATTTLVWTVDFLALKNFCSQRLQNFMQWEINTLARMIREEIRMVYPLCAEVLKPRCEITKTCHAFGNTFEGCGKFPLKNSHNRYVFNSEQATKNLKFDEDSVAKLAEHNKHVPKASKHWLLMVRERLTNQEK